MILNSMIIDNIRSYGHEEIEFPTGISLFEGDVGSGKSTVLMSVEFALFGLGSQRAESLLAKKAESGSVTLEFSVDGERYEVKRALSRKKTGVGQDPKNSWIKAGGQKEPLSPSELKQRILQILKFNEPADPKAESRIFRYAVFTPQEAMKEVLLDPRKRLETIRKAFGIEDYSTAASNAGELLQEIRVRMGRLEGRFSNIPELESENEGSEKTIAELEASIRDASQTQEKRRQSEAAASAELKELREKDSQRVRTEARIGSVKDRIRDAERTVKDIEGDSAGCEAELERNGLILEEMTGIKRPDTAKTVPELDAEIARLQKINDGLIRLDAERDGIRKEIARLREPLGGKTGRDRASLAGALERLQKEGESLKGVLRGLEKEREKAREQKGQWQARKGAIEEEISSFSELGNACPTCEQKIDEGHRHEMVGRKQGQADALERDIRTATDSLEKTGGMVEETQSRMDACDSEIGKIRETVSGIDRLEEKTAELKGVEGRISGLVQERAGKKYGEDPVGDLARVRDGLIRYENAAKRREQIEESMRMVQGRIRKNRESAKAQRELISGSRAELEGLEASCKFGDDLGGQISEKESQLEALRKDISGAEAILAQKAERKAGEESKISKNNERIAESKKWQERFALVSEYAEWVERFFIPTIFRIEKQVLFSILQNFNETYRRWYSILVEDPTKESRIDEDFTPVVSQDGYEQEVRYLSGGEKTSIALAYRLTLNSLMRKETGTMKSNLLILDEPTDGFSKNQLGKIRELLDELKSEQVVLVSHEKELETYVDNVFEISKHDGVSKISENVAGSGNLA